VNKFWPNSAFKKIEPDEVFPVIILSDCKVGSTFCFYLALEFRKALENSLARVVRGKSNP
jgi:hypothetical protein